MRTVDSKTIRRGLLPLWIYNRSFAVAGEHYRVRVTLYSLSMISRVYRGTELVDEQQLRFMEGYHNFAHNIPLVRGGALHVEVGFFNAANVGIVAHTDSGWRHESHPGRNIRWLPEHRHFAALAVEDDAERKLISERWQKNKPSIYADIGLGLIFFSAGKITGDLVQAALIGAGAGLALVVAQRFVKADLLGGFAVFGTVMLLVSAAFSFAFQSEFMVQMKTTILGVLTALLFLADGVFRGGRYFGERMQRYMPATINHARFASGLGLLGLFMAGANYVVARFFSEDVWLTYSTFLDMPLSIILAYAVFFWAVEKTA